MLYLIVHGLSMFFFLYSGAHPGWVEPDIATDLEVQNLNKTHGSSDENPFGHKSKDSGPSESGIELNDIEVNKDS